MKLTVRIFALSIVCAGIAAASTISSSSTHVMVSHQSATANMPIPTCNHGYYCEVLGIK